SARAAQMTNATVSLTISLNNLNGTPWGTAADGGASSFASPFANDLAFGQRTLDEWTRFTGRRQQAGVTQGGTNGTTYPYAEFANLPGTYAQTFFGFMDHNFDWPAISGTYEGAQYGFQIDAVVTALARQLQAQNITCGDASKGQTAFPGVPSAAELAALFALGFGNWMRYGSDPVNFSTGNFLQSKNLFTVSGPGGVSTPVDLTYNSLDSRSGMFGRGWSSGLAAKSQTYGDGSVLVTAGDGSATAFTRNADGSFSSVQPGIYTRLSRTAAHTLTLTMPDSSTEVFTEDSYTGAGVMVSRTDRAGHTWSYTYGTTSITIPATPNPWPVAPDGSSGGSGTPARVITSFGPLASVTEPGGQSLAFTADSAGRVVTATRPDGAAWTLAYDAAGNLASVTDPAGHATSYGYDGSNRMTTVTAPDGTTYVTNTYDDAGRVVKQVNGDGAATTISYGQNSTTYTDTTGAATTFSIDAQGRVTKVVTPLGHTIGTTYKNWDTTASTDGNGNTTKSVYDAQGRLTQTIAADGADTSYSYTAQGDLTSQTLTDGRTTSYTVDAQGRTTAVAGPDGAHWQQTFDTAGNLTSRTDPNGNTTSYGYDGHGNLTSVTDAASGKTTLTYDAASRVTSAVDPDGHTTTFAYDAVGNLTSRTDGAGAVTAYTYQADDKVATITDPNGGVTSYTYNKGLNVATITDPTGGVTR
ncbi:YD repeat-containing protein, partial [Leifsonia sp. CL154]